MTENEAIERIRKQACNDRFLSIHCDDSCLYGAEKCEWAHAIQALEEIQQYRAIGTIDEFKALKEKSTKKRFSIFESHGIRQFVCSCCDRPIRTTDNYCSFCGQKLDWQ